VHRVLPSAAAVIEMVIAAVSRNRDLENRGGCQIWGSGGGRVFVEKETGGLSRWGLPGVGSFKKLIRDWREGPSSKQGGLNLLPSADGQREGKGEGRGFCLQEENSYTFIDQWHGGGA